MVYANYGLSLGAYFGAALNTSESISTDLVPSIFPIAIDGKPYNLDLNNPMGGNLYRRDSVALLRTQADSARTAGESSVSPEIFWRRSFDSWHAGAGQTHADRETSNPYRFRASKGMNVWDKGELKALNDVEAKNISTATITAATRDGTTITYTAINNFYNGQIVTITGVISTGNTGGTAGSGFNLTNATVATASATQFTVTNALSDTYTSGGVATSANNNAVGDANIGLVVAGSRLYWYNGNTTRYTSGTNAGAWAWTTVTGTPANAPAGIASDGKNVWIAHTDAIWKTDTSSTAATTFANPPAGTWTGIWFNKGKLFGSTSDGKVHTISGAGTVTNVIDRSTLGFTWTSATGVGGYHYFAGYNGDKSIIFKVTLTAEGTALGAGIVAGELPDDEKVLHLDAYLGYLIIGTNKGVRFANTDANGYITIGGLIQTNQPVYCSEGQDRFVWFGWGNYDAVSSGLGRMDLAEFTSTLTPAYASDLMAGKPALRTSATTPTAADPILGDVLSVVTYDNKRVFAVKAKGIFTETTTKVPLANLDTGLISHGIIDNKYAAFLDARLEPLASDNVLKLAHASDSEGFATSGAITTTGATYTGEFFLGHTGRNFEVRVVFGDIVPSTLVGANVTCTGFMLRSYPAPKRVSKFSVPVMLFDSINVADRDWAGNPGADFEFLSNLHKRQLPFSFQEGEVSYTVVMDDYQWLPEKRSNVSGFQGTFVAVLREIL
jgi:hypothetical protein